MDRRQQLHLQNTSEPPNGIDFYVQGAPPQACLSLIQISQDKFKEEGNAKIKNKVIATPTYDLSHPLITCHTH